MYSPPAYQIAILALVRLRKSTFGDSCFRIVIRHLFMIKYKTDDTNVLKKINP